MRLKHFLPGILRVDIYNKKMFGYSSRATEHKQLTKNLFTIYNVLYLSQKFLTHISLSHIHRSVLVLCAWIAIVKRASLCYTYVLVHFFIPPRSNLWANLNYIVSRLTTTAQRKEMQPTSTCRLRPYHQPSRLTLPILWAA